MKVRQALRQREDTQYQLESEYPNEETIQAIEDVENGIGLSPLYDTAEDLMKALTTDIDKDAAIFLRNNQKLIPTLNLVEGKIAEYFGNTPLHLEMTADNYLLLLIEVRGEATAAIKRLHEFDEWWVDNETELLSIDVVMA